MKLIPMPLDGSFLIEPEPLTDERGFFARMFCAEEFLENGLDPAVAQCSISYNASRGTLRGMHFQLAPHEESKLVRCTRGAVYDVVLDLRRTSGTYGRWFAHELTADNRAMLYVPKGCAHGFQTLRDDTEVTYQISVPYSPEAAAGVRFDDPAFGIDWPIADPTVSDRDRSFPLTGD